MKENILISLMARNNSSYIPYFYKCIDLVEKENKNYNINYIIFTNNNEDNTLELLKSKTSKNFKVVEKNYDKEFLNKPRVEKLHYLREDFLHIIRKEEFDYLLMIDSCILFNEKMILDSIKLIKKEDCNAVTANSIHYNSPFYYDIFSLMTKECNNYEPNILTDKFLRKFYYDTFYKNKNKKVESAYGGFFLTTSKIIKNKNLSYTKKNKQITNFICEHKYFNKQIKDIIFASNINPLWCNEETKQEYENSYKIIEQNNSENRNIFRLIYAKEVKIVLGIILFLFLIFLLKRINLRIYSRNLGI